jgi:protein-tyrosine-phosphatase
MGEGIYNSICGGGAISRGLFAVDGESASKNAIAAMAKRGIDISKHLSKKITLEDVAEADEVFAMTSAHKEMLVSALPQFEYKIKTLGEAAGGPDVSDPYGGSEEVYESCAAQIEKYIRKVVEG